MASELQGIRIHFFETMSGYASLGGSSFADGFEEGRAAGLPLSLHVNVDVDDLADFLASPEHGARLTGWVEGPLVGGRAEVESGHFMLMPDTADLKRKIMNYRVYCVNADGERFTLAGQKEVQHHFGFDLWKDTTTLYTNLFVGHVAPEDAARADLLATGILSLGVADFVKVLRTVRASDAAGNHSLKGLAAFGEFFAGSLWQVYGPSLPPRPYEAPRVYARFTTEGVRGATITEHPFSTGDGLGLSLTRFQRNNCDDVVLVIHGLTTSSDMFIMPEHENLVQHLLNEGYGDVFTLDHRGSNRFPYNLIRGKANLDDLALYDHPAAIATLRQIIGPNKRLHVIAHCVGALTFGMSLAAGQVGGIQSAILNSIALTACVPPYSALKLGLGPFACDYLLGVEYVNPRWRHQPGWSPAKLLAMGVDWFHPECDSSECHMLSFMWGAGKPALFLHENMAPETHDRLGDLFGGISVNYYRHVLKMVKADHEAVKFAPEDPRYASLPDNYFAAAASISTPMLLTTGQQNGVFADSNIVCHERLERLVPGRHQLHVYPNYGHQDVFMGKNVAQDTFPRMLAFLRAHSA
ncbi:alpha/beta hydrolase [Chitinimonas taiwanensis]|uniref:Cholesterol oxidase n=1 Tax=Chitinimonas taiwanensis DSM 18899 TaxID=1121279 RepID=A0A1K2HQW8_9NEIS|nr:alpha/beta fold hydrolase [Chitinimonas taiwanensis]SFZ79101.1 cholesterol oxidase [Chitinimonas taiwanensis DSM 18899]